MMETNDKKSITVKTNVEELDIDMVYDYLSKESYWAMNIPRHVFETGLRNSLCFGVFHNNQQVGFARVITDKATFAYLCDVFILSSHRGRGLGVYLMNYIMQYPCLQGLRRFMLATRDAHSLYEKFGFGPPQNPSRLMEIVNKDIYKIT